ncbi:MAG TPA: tetratricopeptide repeat protein [Sphingobium sp.]|nr:tetratricopeptide repeat protein [Sphingobium sp.]
MRRKRLFLFVAAAAALLSLTGLWQWHRGQGDAALSRGIAALAKGDARTARVELMNAVRAHPRSVAARIAQARALLDLSDGEGAQAEIERARKLGAADGATRHLMAEALLLQGYPDKALQEALSADVPPDAAAMVARLAGQAWLAKEEMAPAAAAFDRALKLAPKDAANWVAVGRFRMAAGDQAGAITAAGRALSLSPQGVKALTLRGELIREQYGLTASLPWFERALEQSPDNVPTLEHYAATLADMGQARRMLSVTRHLLAIDPDNARAWMMQAVMAARAGRVDLARRLLDRIGGRLDGEPATRLLRGVLQLENGNALLAAQSLSPLVADQPDNRVARTLLGRALLEAGDHAAAATLAPLVAQRDADPYVLTLAARAQESMGRSDMAQDMLARAAWPTRSASEPIGSPGDAAIAAGPAPGDSASASANIPYIRALLTMGRAGAAVERARLLNRANPGAPAAWLILGDALQAAGRLHEAVQAYESGANIRFSRDVALRLAAAWQRLGDAGRSAQIVRLFLAQNPNDVDAQRLAAAIAMQAGDWKGALRLLRAVQARIGSSDPLLLADLARAALESGDAGSARRYAALAYRLMPASPVTADMYGWTLVASGQKGQAAVDLLEKAVALAPGHPVPRAHLARAYAAMRARPERLAAR